jgi:tetratricopeptide (TPR) repeat protein
MSYLPFLSHSHYNSKLPNYDRCARSTAVIFPSMKHPRTFLLAIAFFLAPWLSSLAQEDLTDLYYSGNYREVIDASGTLIASGDTAINTFYLKALSQAQLGQPVEAIHTLQLALTLKPGELRLSRMLARQCFDAGYYIQARQGYDDLVQRDSTDVSSWLKLAEIASFRQQYQDAIEALNQVLAIDSMNLNSLMMMGDILNRHNKSQALLYYEQAYHLYPENQKAASAVANLYIQTKDARKAIPVCTHMLEIDSTSIKFSKLLGYAFYKAGGPAQAVTWFNHAVALGDSTAFTFKFKGISHYLQTYFNNAIESLQFALKKDSLDAEVHFFLGASLATTTTKDEAMMHLNKSLQLMQPDSSIVSRIYSEQGNIKRLETEYEEAYDLYNKAWEMDTTNAISLYFMASILDNSMHKHKEALVDYQRYIDALDQLPEKEDSNQGVSIRAIVEDRIITLKEEMFFRDE